jgi:hypothetical protein
MAELEKSRLGFGSSSNSASFKALAESNGNVGRLPRRPGWLKNPFLVYACIGASLLMNGHGPATRVVRTAPLLLLLPE